MSASLPAPAVLLRARSAIQPALTAAVGRLSPGLARLATYHFGWTDADGRPTGAPGGKGLRPALALLSAEAVGAEAAVGVPGGVALELVHNFSLIHDDIIDGDRTRHHRPTVWVVYGVGPAIIAGDALEVLAHQVLLDASAETGAAAAEALSEATATMITGQAEDVAFELRAAVTLEECVAMSAAKTGALLGCAAAIGAVLAGAPPATTSALRSYGEHLGLAFQAADDLLGIWGDPEVTGKPAGNDLRQRKKSLPVCAALGSGRPEAVELQALLSGPGPDHAGQHEPLDQDQVDRAAKLVEACGGRDWAVGTARSHLAAATAALGQVRLQDSACRELAELAAYVIDRDA